MWQDALDSPNKWHLKSAMIQIASQGKRGTLLFTLQVHFLIFFSYFCIFVEVRVTIIIEKTHKRVIWILWDQSPRVCDRAKVNSLDMNGKEDTLRDMCTCKKDTAILKTMSRKFHDVIIAFFNLIYDRASKRMYLQILLRVPPSRDRDYSTNGFGITVPRKLAVTFRPSITRNLSKVFCESKYLRMS